MLRALWRKFNIAGVPRLRRAGRRLASAERAPINRDAPQNLEARIDALLAQRLGRLVLPPDVHALYLERTAKGNRKMMASWCAWVGWLNLAGLPFDVLLLPRAALPFLITFNFAVIFMFLLTWRLLKRNKLVQDEHAAIIFVCLFMMCFTGCAGLLSAGQGLLEHFLTGGVVIAFTAIMFVRLERRQAVFLGVSSTLLMLCFIVAGGMVPAAVRVEWAFFDAAIMAALIHARQVQNLYQYRLFLLQTRDELRNNAAVRLNDQLSSIAYTDKLTELPNRRYFDEICGSVNESTKNLLPLSLCLMDIDQFKRLNDRLGHLQGDRCLRVVANAIRSQLRGASDILARYGGEEFVLLLPHTEKAAAMAIAERIRTAVLEIGHPHPAVESGVVTISIGVAVAAERPVLIEDLLNQADKALYVAKHGGRNRVCADGQPVPGGV